MTSMRNTTPLSDAASSSVLLEIGTEEIPARFLPTAIEDLKAHAARTFAEYRIDHGEVQAFATPRRLILIVREVSPAQSDVAREVFGPSKKAAFDEQGAPTRAATGFAQSVGVPVSGLVIRMKGKGEYLAAIIEEKGVTSEKVLPDILRKIVLSLHFPKSMRWGMSDLSFVRPIRWILALFGAEIVQFEIGETRSSNMTRGHRFLSPAWFQIKDIDSYASVLEHNFVVLDQEKRKTIIRKGITGLFEKSDVQPILDEDLLTTVSFIVEYPVAVLCDFDASYLDLPKELLVTVMKDHQKYFAAQDRNGNLSNRFVVISNTRADNADTVRIGAERVIKARFDDAQFYFSEDREMKLADRVDLLKNVTFHDELGNLYEKTGRIIALASFLSDAEPSTREKATRAALLSKTDLITGVVREFPELQGIMGKYYGLHDGEDREVAEALEEQYLPQGFGGRNPQTGAGSVLSIADKADTIAGFFSIGLLPTGSEDPFALRRQAMGIISVMMETGYRASIGEIFRQALQPFAGSKPADSVFDQIMRFMAQRVEFMFSSLGYADDHISAIIPFLTERPVAELRERAETLKQFTGEEGFGPFLLAVKRIGNIVPKTPLPPLNPGLFEQDEERLLHEDFLRIRGKFLDHLGEGRFLEGLRTLSGITAPVNSFFDKILVMDKREAVKANRLALLREIWETALHAADFSSVR